VQLSPRGTWLMYRVADNAPITRAGLALLLGIADSELEQRLTELVNAGYVSVDGPAPAARQAGDAEPVLPESGNGTRAGASLALTSAGEQAAAQLRAVREAGIDRLVTDWKPDQAPELRRLIGRVTTTLVATDPAPEHDAAGTPAAPIR
jgi:hypothetical protein